VRRGRAAVGLRSIVHLDSVRAYVDALVHPSARGDALTAARHRAFIAVRLLGGAIALAAIPLYLAWRSTLTPFEGLVFACFLLPLLVVSYLSRTGEFERAHLFSAATLTGIVAMIAAATGGVTSFALCWLAVVPMEAALSASRRVVLATLAMTSAAIVMLGALGMAGMLPAAAISSLAHALGGLSAAFYAGAVALGVSAFARTGEHATRAGDARYRMLAHNMTDLITRHARNGAVTFVSPAAERMIGVPAAALAGHGMFERVHVADRPGFLTALTDAARGIEAAIEYRLLHGPAAARRQPEFIWVETRCRQLGGSHGEVVAVTRDISRNKRDADEVAAARSEAERASEAKSRFLATVSHELRTPLNAIIGFSEMLAHETAHRLDPERRMDYARLIRDSGQHLLAVVNGILDVSRIEAGRFALKPEAFAIAPLAEACYEMMLLRAEQAGVRLDLKIAPALPEIVADKLALRQILINLLSNAVKFTPRGGSVTVSVRMSGNDCLLSVADTGIGIAEADLAQVGDPFFQASASYDRPYEGTGLGLSVVKGLVELHGGRFEIASRLGEGTCVTARIPRVCRAPVAASAEPAIEQLASRRQVQEIEKVKRSA
jgi:cell cycle sensor histidine kinase DivJ